jgi:hypothetical protein
MEQELESMDVCSIPTDESTDDCSMIRKITEWCPVCEEAKGHLTVRDDNGEDCNYFNMLKNYRFTQRSSHPYKCSCGSLLKPVENI